MDPNKGKIILIGGALVVALVFVLILVFGAKTVQTGAGIKLTVWGTDPGAPFNRVIEAYTKAHQGSSIRYIPKDPATYENELIKAFAAGTGPDVFYLSNHSLGKLHSLIAPISSATFNSANLNELFPSVVADDFSAGGMVYALPLYMDTLSLFYNRDIFDRNFVVAPPTTWKDFQDLAAKLRVLNDKGQVDTAGAAMGGSEKTVANATDILNMLMMQNGTQMISEDSSRATFADGSSPAFSAFNFYLQFTNPASPSYTWNEAQPFSLDSFAAGSTAMVFGYQSDLSYIKRKSPYLKVGVAAVPQVSSSSLVAYPSYQGLTVSRRFANQTGAWDFVQFVTAQSANNILYLNDADRSPALRSLIGPNVNDPTAGPFIRQALIARSWYAPDYDKIKQIFSQAIQEAISGQVSSDRALKEAQANVTFLLR